MASFFQKARERAEQAAQQFQAQHLSGSASAASSDSKSHFSYAGAVPHLVRQGIASLDPRYEANRQFHLLSQAIKSLNIDREATAREAKGVAKATFVWGQSHLPENRIDSVGDEMLVDVTDRIAYIFHELSQLEAAHCARSEQARATLKRFEKSEIELAPRKEARIRLKKDLQALVPERARPTSAVKTAEMEKQLQSLMDGDQADEEYLSRIKRESTKQGYTALFDSMIELGEKMALLARYGKVLTSCISTESSSFPATIKPRDASIPLWEGAVKTAQIRAAIGPALAAYQPSQSLPIIPEASAADTLSLGRADTVSYGVSHKDQLDHEDETVAVPTPASPILSGRRRRSSASEHARPMEPFGNHGRLNLSPSNLPPQVPPRRGASALDNPSSAALRSPILESNAATSPARGGSLAIPIPGSHDFRHDSGTLADTDVVGASPPTPTVAETGVIPSGASGPKSGTLKPRKSLSQSRSVSLSAGAVAYLGPPGTYSHQAAVKVFGQQGSNLIPMQSITSAVDFVRRGSPFNVKYAIVPIENSTFGPVKEAVEAICNHNCGDKPGSVLPSCSDSNKAFVVGEFHLSVQHALLCGPKTWQHLLQMQGSSDPLDDVQLDTLAHVTNVISHEQALGQCGRFLSKYLAQARKRNVDSTAGAVTAALECENGTAPGLSTLPQPLDDASGSLVVAIGPEVCTDQGVHVIRTNIQDVPDNRTRFVVLASEPAKVVSKLPALPGSLGAFLEVKQPDLAVNRGMLRVFDPLVSDVAMERDHQKLGQDTCRSTSVQGLLDEISREPKVRVRKIDRQPAPFQNTTTHGSSVWKSSYLVEVEVDGDLSEAAGCVEAIASKFLPPSSHAKAKQAEASEGLVVDYLGVWQVNRDHIVDAQESCDSAAENQRAEVGSVYPSTPHRARYDMMASASSSSSAFSDLATPGHGQMSSQPSLYGSMPVSGSSSSFGTDTTVHGAGKGTRSLTEKERKELEARQEADEVRWHAEQARFNRNQQQTQLYGIPPPTTEPTQSGRLEGLMESQNEEDAEPLPAYEPWDGSKQLK